MGDIISLGLWIKRRRKALDLTQDELAQRVGCSLAMIQKIEGDARRPSREIAALLADKLELADDQRVAFIQSARAELGADRLVPPTQTIGRSAFVSAPALAGQPAPTAPPAAALPSGTVTFLFTDIEGSTRLWEQYPQAMAGALAQHDAILRQAITTATGIVYTVIGDAFQAAFPTAPLACAAALAAQHALTSEDWGVVGAVPVRMALHTCAAVPTDGDYRTGALNRLGRLLGVIHGGQIVLSCNTADLAYETLPPDVTLRDLGEHHLRDLRPEHLFQVVSPDLPADFPPLKTLDRQPHNLPTQPTALIGREHEIVMICRLLHRADVRLVTLTGPGGIGKTRLSLQVAAELVEEFADGVYFVDLAPIREPRVVSSAIAQTLGVRETGGQPLLVTLMKFDNQIR
jgi:class 3 adenylate cyclase